MHPSKTRLSPTRIAPETFLLHNHEGEGTAPVSVALNTMLIRSREPVVVDTGLSTDDKDFVASLAAVIDPADVRWIWLTHPDRDHTGGLHALLDAG